MKKHIKITRWIVFCVFAGSCLFFTSASMAGQAEKAAPVPNLVRYEDKAIGFSIEYDAQKLTKDLGSVGPFVFRRESADGMPSVGITAGPYPVGTSLAATADLIYSSLPQVIPGCVIQSVNNRKIIKLADGTEANYFEMQLNIGEMESIAAFVAAKRDDQLIVFGTLDRKDGSMDNLTAMVKSLSFDVEVDQAALMARGFGKDGKFVRTDPPAFTLEYPKEFQKRVLQGNQIFRAGIPQGSPSMSIAILSLMAGVDIQRQLKEMAEGYANALKSVGSDVKIISQNPVEEYKGFDAYQIQIVWRYQSQVTLTTVVDLIAKQDKALQLAGHTVYSIDELTDIFHTIDLDP
jgi:hypothetical protein